VPAGFRSWAEFEDRATELLVRSPGIIIPGDTLILDYE
jgi:hypothetical protein